MKPKIRCLVMDVDGTLTDGKIYMGSDGEVLKAFNIKDGYGIHDILIPAGIIPIIITGRTSQILENRCRELGITELYQGIHNKLDKLDDILRQLGYTYANVAYIGDDLNDLKCMVNIQKNQGFVGCPADAAPQIIAVANYICQKRGGEGAVREFIEWLISL